MSFSIYRQTLSLRFVTTFVHFLWQNILMSLSMLAFAQTNNGGQIDSTERVWEYHETQFVRPPQQYTHLLYDQILAIDPSRGLEPLSVIQPISKTVDTEQPATPLAYQPMRPNRKKSVKDSMVTRS